ILVNSAGRRSITPNSLSTSELEVATSNLQLRALSQKSDQVGHFLQADQLLDSVRHERTAARSQFFDLGSEDGLLDPLGASDFQRCGRFFGEQARDHLAPPSSDGKRDIVGCDITIRVEHIGQKRLGCTARDARKVGADAMPLPLVLMTSLT